MRGCRDLATLDCRVGNRSIGHNADKIIFTHLFIHGKKISQFYIV